MAKQNLQTETRPVDPELLDKALAKAVSDGDIVNFRLMFMAASPARPSTAEHLDNERYRYLLPDSETEGTPEFREALGLVRSVEIRAHVQRELEADRPAQLPSELLLPLADNAVRARKYTSAAQAYELLRIRARMQELFLDEADKALDEGATSAAVRGYVIASGLAYDYAAFPEPMPRVPNFAMRALLLHGEYPQRPEQCIGMQEPEILTQTALSYLLLDAEAAGRLAARPLDMRLSMLKQLNAWRDPEWDAFVGRFKEAHDVAKAVDARLRRCVREQEGGAGALAEEIALQEMQELRQIAPMLLGRSIEKGQWWQYLKEVAYLHPAAALFLARRLVGDEEVLIPYFNPESPVAAALGIR